MELDRDMSRYSATPVAREEDRNRDGTSIDFGIQCYRVQITLGNHGFITGDKVTYNSDPSGQPAGGLTDKDNYFIIKIDNDSFRLVKSKSYARQGFAIDVTSQGRGGDHKFSVINEGSHFVEPDDDFGFNESFTTY